MQSRHLRLFSHLHLQGLEGFLSSKEALKRRPRQFRLEDRLFSLSSKTSPAVSCSLNPMLCFPANQELALQYVNNST